MPNGERLAVAGPIHTGHVSCEEGLVIVEGDRILYAGPQSGGSVPEFANCQVLEPGQAVIPGLVDLHCHGGFGTDFSSSEEEQVRDAIESLHRRGTTTLLASLVTATEEVLLRVLPSLGNLTNEQVIAGVHLEGPFLSSYRCGAQDPAWMREPDIGLAKRLIGASGGALRTMTLAPELSRSFELIEVLVNSGVIPSFGHTDASPAAAKEAVNLANAALTNSLGGRSVPTVTHLFNAMPAIHHRSPGPIPVFLESAARGRAVVELIADGAHLDPQVVRWTYDLVGAENIALVTDSMAATGLSDGAYNLGPASVRVTDGKATLASNGSLAGGTATMLDVLRHTVAAGVPLEKALLSATIVPTQVLGRPRNEGGLVPGGLADLLIVSDELELAAVMRHGRWIAAPPRSLVG